MASKILRHTILLKNEGMTKAGEVFCYINYLCIYKMKQRAYNIRLQILYRIIKQCQQDAVYNMCFRKHMQNRTYLKLCLYIEQLHKAATVCILWSWERVLKAWFHLHGLFHQSDTRYFNIHHKLTLQIIVWSDRYTFTGQF